MRSLLKKIIDISVIILCLALVLAVFFTYFILHKISLPYFIILELFLGSSLVATFFIYFNKINSVREILMEKQRQIGDKFLAIWGVLFALTCLYMVTSWTLDRISRNILALGGIFFGLGGIFLLVSNREATDSDPKTKN
jgi:glucan phosphoethanolaminetransferase (alkaline phosphatase superfamily)